MFRLCFIQAGIDVSDPMNCHKRLLSQLLKTSDDFDAHSGRNVARQWTCYSVLSCTVRATAVTSLRGLKRTASAITQLRTPGMASVLPVIMAL